MDIIKLRLKERFGYDKWQFEIFDADGKYHIRLHLKEEKYNLILPISKTQLTKLGKAIINHLQIKEQKAEYEPSDSDIIESFERHFTGSGKLYYIMKWLNNDPQLKEWVRKSIDGEDLR